MSGVQPVVGMWVRPHAVVGPAIGRVVSLGLNTCVVQMPKRKMRLSLRDSGRFVEVYVRDGANRGLRVIQKPNVE